MNRTESLAKLRTILLKRQEELLQALKGDLSLLGGHDEDDDEWYEDGTTTSLVDNESQELQAIKNALRRMREGSYGICEDCNCEIRLERLQALPYATTCVRCRRESEQ
jgi:DnaK suppressor protein